MTPKRSVSTNIIKRNLLLKDPLELSKNVVQFSRYISKHLGSFGMKQLLYNLINEQYSTVLILLLLIVLNYLIFTKQVNNILIAVGNCHVQSIQGITEVELSLKRKIQ